MTIGYFVEFPNNDVGPFRTCEDAEAYRRYEGNLDETQVFTSDVTGEMIDLATFCPDAAASVVRDPESWAAVAEEGRRWR